MGVMSRPGNDDYYGQILSTTLTLDSKVTTFLPMNYSLLYRSCCDACLTDSSEPKQHQRTYFTCWRKLWQEIWLIVGERT